MTQTGAQAINPILSLRGVSVDYRTKAGLVRAVADVSLDVAQGESLSIVGESGCGKSTLARAILQLPRPTAGAIAYQDNDLTTLSGAALRRLRPELQLVFQDPISSLNPRRRVRDIVAEPLDIWSIGTRAERAERVNKMLLAVGLDPDVYAGRRPAQMSGGQCQRVAIARALISGTKILLCDEAISSLDVSLRAQVINLIEDLKAEFGFALLFIAHDLAVVKNISDRVAVMYLGRVVELGNTDDIYADPAHPYTLGLLGAVRSIEMDQETTADVVPGEPPSPINPPSGCPFRTRCPFAQEICAEEIPRLRPIGAGGRTVACHFPLTGSDIASPVFADDA
jgi:peptide/nickel transport system ATP-binding protein